MTRSLAVASLLCLCALPIGSAACQSVREIAPFCSRSVAGQERAVQYGVCMGTVGTIIAMSDLMYKTQDMCIPEKISVADAAAVVQSYVNQHPEAGDKDFTTIAVGSLRTAFPCH